MCSVLFCLLGLENPNCGHPHLCKFYIRLLISLTVFRGIYGIFFLQLVHIKGNKMTLKGPLKYSADSEFVVMSLERLPTVAACVGCSNKTPQAGGLLCREEIYFSSGGWKSQLRILWCLVRACFPVHGQPSSPCVLRRWKRPGSFLELVFVRALIPFVSALLL